MRTHIRIEDFSFLVKMVYFNYIQNILSKELMKPMGDNTDLSEYIKLTKEKLENITEEKFPLFKYQNLMDQTDTYMLSKTPMDITIHKIDDFMVDVYRTYINIESIIHKSKGVYEDEHEDEQEDEQADDEKNEDFIKYLIHKSKGVYEDEQEDDGENEDFIKYFQKGVKSIIKIFTKLKIIFDDIMLNYEFTETEIRGIQKNYLNDMIKENIEVENYETAGLIRDKIKTI